MTITHRNTLLAAAILGFGLVSCSKETEIRYQQDKYEPRDILVKKDDTTVSALERLSNVDLSHRLEINTADTPAAQRIKTLEISAQCRLKSSDSTYTLETKWVEPKSIDLMAILPIDVLLLKKSENIVCELNYTTTNMHNSSNLSQIQQIEVSNLETFTNLGGGHPLAVPDVAWSSLQAGVTVPLENAVSTIACDDFIYTSGKLGAGATVDQLLDPSVYKSGKTRSSKQSCRAIFKNRDAVAVTPVFRLNLPVAPLSYTFQFSKRTHGNATVDSNHSVVYSITNPNDYPVAIKADVDGRLFKLRTIMWTAGNYYPSETITRSIRWIFNGSELPLSSQTEFMIPAKSVGYLEGRFNGRIDCLPTAKIHFIGSQSDLNADVSFSYTDANLQLQQFTPPYTGYVQNSPSLMRYWDIPEQTLSHHNTNLSGVIHWVRWGSQFAMATTPAEYGLNCIQVQ